MIYRHIYVHIDIHVYDYCTNVETLTLPRSNWIRQYMWIYMTTMTYRHIYVHIDIYMSTYSYMYMTIARMLRRLLCREAPGFTNILTYVYEYCDV